MAGHPEFLRIIDEMRALHCRKAADYGRGADPLANCRGSADFGVPAWVGTMIRAMDKVHRIKSFVQNGTLKNESVEDSLQDLAAYAIIALVLYREEHGGPPPVRPACLELATEEPAKKRVYIAGPISKGDLLTNINQATEAFLSLVRAGFAPFCPHWSVYAKPCRREAIPQYMFGDAETEGVLTDEANWPIEIVCTATKEGGSGVPHETWLSVDLPWVAAADAVYRLPGESAGADRETAHAERLGVPVFTYLPDLIAHFDPHHLQAAG